MTGRKSWQSMNRSLPAALAERGDIDLDPQIIETYCRGGRGEKGSAMFVARPRTTQDASDIIRACVEQGIQLVPQSARTGLVGASVPDSEGHHAVLSLERMTGDFQLDRINRTVTCSAGIRLSDINARLASEALCLPIDVGSDPCIGGMVATNTGGSRLMRYGDFRRHVLGLTVVLGDSKGTIVRLGGALRKTSTGPDWKQLFVGTGASFGVITECTFNVEPAPKHRATALIALPDESALPDLLLELERRFGSLLSALEFMSANAMRAAHSHVPSLRKPFGGDLPDIALLVELSCDWPLDEADRSLDDILIGGLVDIAESDAASMGDVVIGRAEEVWAIRHALSEGVRKRGRLYAFDLSFRRGDVLRFRAAMKARLIQLFPDIEICDFGHVGDGGIHFNLVDHLDASDWSPDRERTIRDTVIKAAVEDFDGSYSAEHGIGPVNYRYFDTYASAETRHFSAALEAVTSGRRLGRVHFSQEQPQ
jgi:FAD/FMN-containing dehydrogenase